jgi:hypothetical protein
MLLRRTGFAAMLAAGVVLLAGGLQGVVGLDGPLEVATSSQQNQHVRQADTGAPPATRPAADYERRGGDRGDCPHRT